MSQTLAIGMTVGYRNNKGTIYDYCEQAVVSLRRAGFGEQLHAFVEPEAHVHIPAVKRWNINLLQNEERRQCYGNFRHGLNWLLDNTDADWLMMLQDDCIWRQDGAERVYAAMADKKLAKAGMLSPYTSPAMVPPAKRDEKMWEAKNEWCSARFHNNSFWGAVALIFPRASALKLENDSQRFRNHTHHRKLDVVVGNAFRAELDMPIMVHVPSLCDHVGSWSTLGRHRFRGTKWGRRGFLFRAK